ncbi:MAG: serine/threonine-protein kinase [Alphaproteobacteria bacterium]|nr:serine/threonine-protein kinase [Alphaproteobacteria bacterium]
MTQRLRHALPAGYRLEDYEIETILGHGGFGVTYLARDVRLRAKVAIKEYMPADLAVREGEFSVHPRAEGERAEFEWGLERFLQEAQTLARFKHPNIVPVHRFFVANGTAYLVMNYEEGESLADYFKRKGTLREADIWPILIPLLDGLAEVHKAGFLHRDIKPGNIVLRSDGSPVLLDFGSARQALGRKSKSLTAVVTAGFAPVEQYGSGGEQGPWTDIYALAAVLYRAVTGLAPPESPDRATAILRGGRDPMAPALEAAKGRCSARVLAAIDKGLAVLETERPKSVDDWRTLLFGGRHPAAGPAAPKQGRGAAVGAVLGFLAAVLLVGAGYAGWQLMQDDQRAAEPRQAEQGTQAADGAVEDDAAAAARAAAEAEEKRKAAEEARRQAEAEAKRKAEEEARRQAAAEAERKAAEAARKRAAAEATRRAEQEARRRAEADAKRKAEEAARRTARTPQQASRASTPPQTAKATSGPTARLEDMFSGSSAYFSACCGAGILGAELDYKVDFGANGLLRGYRQNLQLAEEEYDSGAWSVEGGKLCMKWSKWDDGQKHCYAISGDGQRLAASGSQGILEGPFRLLK